MQIPDTTVLCCDSFFGSHNIARELAGKGQPFLLLTKRDKTDETLNEAQRATKEGQGARAVGKGAKYEVVVSKNPKVGHKPPQMVPSVTKVWFPEEGPQHRRSVEELSPVVAAYRDFSPAVHGCMHGWCQPNGPPNAAAQTANDVVACRPGIHASVCRRNAFAACKRLGLIDSRMSMWDFQWNCFPMQSKSALGSVCFLGSPVHSPTPEGQVWHLPLAAPEVYQTQSQGYHHNKSGRLHPAHSL